MDLVQKLGQLPSDWAYVAVSETSYPEFGLMPTKVQST